MKRYRRRKCRNCRELFLPDPRNLRHQHYCSKPACRRAGKAASQRRWLSKPANRDYFRGEENVQRVRAWRAAHSGYWQRGSPQAAIALQDLLCAQPFVLIELIENLTGTALQEDIARTGRRLQQLGQDILTGGQAATGGDDANTSVGPFPDAAHSRAVQLDRSAPGA